MDIEYYRKVVLQCVSKIPRVKEENLVPSLEDEILGGRIGLDSFDFAELVVLLENETQLDPFAHIEANREAAKTFDDLASIYYQVSCYTSMTINVF